MEADLFPSKILLLGEYIVLLNAKALVMPFSHFSGRLEFKNSKVPDHHDKVEFSNQILTSLYLYIKETIDKTELKGMFDLRQFEQDISQGLYFNSNIPVGYGIGSSGALTAAVYDKYVRRRDNSVSRSEEREDIMHVKRHLAYFESFFHNHSSGVDPLVSYYNKPLLISDQFVEILDFSLTKISRLFIVLIDTKTIRKTSNLVEQFLDNCKDPGYLAQLRDELIRVSDICIQAFLEGNDSKFYQHIKELSAFQFRYFRSMIPYSFLSFWEQGLLSGEYALKLCGSGGGGYMLGFVNNYENFVSTAQQFSLSVLPIQN